MNIKAAKLQLQEALSGPNAKYWAHGPAVKALMDELNRVEARNAELEATCGALAAENAVLKSGAGFFMYSEETGFEFHKTKAEAVTSAEDMIGVCREEAESEGWPEHADSICWGVILQKAVEGQFEKPADENGWIGWSEYSLSPSTETPATDAFLAEVRAQGADECIRQLVISDDDDFSDAPNVCAMVAHQLRKGATE